MTRNGGNKRERDMGRGDRGIQTHPSIVGITITCVYSSISQDILEAVVHIASLATVVAKAYCGKKKGNRVHTW